MSNEELLSALDRYLDGVLNGVAELTSSIRGKTVTESDAMRCRGFVEQAYRFLCSYPSVADCPLLRPMDPERTKQATFAAVKSYAASHALQEMTREDYYSLPEGSFQREARKIFFEFLEIQKATGTL